MAILRSIFGVVILLAATASQGTGQVLGGPRGPVEFIGLERWRAQELLEAIQRIAPDQPLHACAATMKSQLGFADAAVVVHYDSYSLEFLMSDDAEPYTVIVGVEDNDRVRYRTPGSETIHLPERWRAMKSLGRQYRLKVVRHGRPGVKMIRGFIIVHTRAPEKPEVTRRLVEGWYRKRARAKFAERLETSLARFPDPAAFRPKGLIVRRMEKRWGSLSPSGRLLLNRRLIEAPVDTIDYVIAHELCHMAEPHHGAEFYRLLDRVMPDWAARKGRLEERMA